MFSRAGHLAILSIYDTIMFFVQKLAGSCRCARFDLDSIVSIAGGAIDAAASGRDGARRVPSPRSASSPASRLATSPRALGVILKSRDDDKSIDALSA